MKAFLKRLGITIERGDHGFIVNADWKVPLAEILIATVLAVIVWAVI